MMIGTADPIIDKMRAYHASVDVDRTFYNDKRGLEMDEDRFTIGLAYTF